jgi:hypothetical protein
VSGFECKLEGQVTLRAREKNKVPKAGTAVHEMISRTEGIYFVPPLREPDRSLLSLRKIWSFEVSFLLKYASEEFGRNPDVVCETLCREVGTFLREVFPDRSGNELTVRVYGSWSGRRPDIDVSLRSIEAKD